MISFRSRRLDHTHDAPNKRNMCKIHGGGGGGGEFRKFAVFFPSLLVLRGRGEGGRRKEEGFWGITWFSGEMKGRSVVPNRVWRGTITANEGGKGGP